MKNEEVERYKTSTHDEIKSIFNDLYNGFYLKYRSLNNKNFDWNEIMKDAQDFGKKHPGTLATKMIVDILTEFEKQSLQTN